MTEPTTIDQKTAEATAQESAADATKHAKAADTKPAAKRSTKSSRTTKAAVKTTRSAAAKAGAKAEAKKPAGRRRTTAKKSESEVVAPADVSLDSPLLYTNREISWIEFDRKVLETAMDVDVPLLDEMGSINNKAPIKITRK